LRSRALAGLDAAREFLSVRSLLLLAQLSLPLGPSAPPEARSGLQMIPYVLTVVALVGLVGRAVPPAALGRE